MTFQAIVTGELICDVWRKLSQTQALPKMMASVLCLTSGGTEQRVHNLYNKNSSDSGCDSPNHPCVAVQSNGSESRVVQA